MVRVYIPDNLHIPYRTSDRTDMSVTDIRWDRQSHKTVNITNLKYTVMDKMYYKHIRTWAVTQ